MSKLENLILEIIFPVENVSGCFKMFQSNFTLLAYTFVKQVTTMRVRFFVLLGLFSFSAFDLRNFIDLSRSTSAPLNQVSALSPARDVVLHRSEGDGFGFVIFSPINNNGSTIGKTFFGFQHDIITHSKKSDYRITFVRAL